MSIFNLFGSKKKADTSKTQESDIGSHEDRVKAWKEKEATRKAGGHHKEALAKEEKLKERKRLEEEKLKERKRLKELLDRYGQEFASAVHEKKLQMDMPRELVDEILGQPEDTKESVTKTKTKVRAFYGVEKGDRGGTSYRLEVSFENNKVSGWKDN